MDSTLPSNVPTEQFKDVKKFYQEQLERYYPDDIRCMGWMDTREYSLRFRLACKIADLSHATILDVGCGTGGLLAYLKGKGIPVIYHGIDILEEMVTICYKNHSDSIVRQANILLDTIEPAQYVFCLGSLNIEEPGFHETFLKMVDRMIELATKGVVLNFLSDSTFLVPGRYHFEDSAVIKKYIEEKHSKRVLNVAIHDEELLAGECTMFIYLRV